jgi:hypothetical protein
MKIFQPLSTALALSFASLIPAMSQAASNEVRANFSLIPQSVQDSLAQMTGRIHPGMTTTVWKGVDNGRVVYSGKIMDIDGSSRTIEVDQQGRFVRRTTQGPHRSLAFSFGRKLDWANVPPAVQQTVTANAKGRAVSKTVWKVAVNGVPLYEAHTLDDLGNPVVIETTADGKLVAIKDKAD